MGIEISQIEQKKIQKLAKKIDEQIKTNGFLDTEEMNIFIKEAYSLGYSIDDISSIIGGESYDKEVSDKLCLLQELQEKEKDLKDTRVELREYKFNEGPLGEDNIISTLSAMFAASLGGFSHMYLEMKCDKPVIDTIGTALRAEIHGHQKLANSLYQKADELNNKFGKFLGNSAGGRFFNTIAVATILGTGAYYLGKVITKRLGLSRDDYWVNADRIHIQELKAEIEQLEASINVIRGQLMSGT